MTFKELLTSLQGSMIQAAVGVVLSFVAEYVPAYDRLDRRAKRLVMMGVCVGVPTGASLVAAALGYQPWDFEATFWPGIYAGAMVFFGSQAAHLRELGR